MVEEPNQNMGFLSDVHCAPALQKVHSFAPQFSSSLASGEVGWKVECALFCFTEEGCDGTNIVAIC
jgi:hypothetical protein